MRRILFLFLPALLGVLSVNCFPVGAAAQEAPALDADGLLPPDHNPAAVPPLGAPDTTDPGLMVPAVAMTAFVQNAILLFDATPDSERHYDLVSCLDGLTFGFGNWPQPEIGEFFTELDKDDPARTALAQRFLEVFQTDGAAWDAFKTAAALHDAQPNLDSIAAGIHALLAQSKLKKANLVSTKNGACSGSPSKGESFYFDNRKWLVPAGHYAFRDPAIVKFQVAYWKKDVIDPAIKHAEILKLNSDATLLMAFYESNPGQAPAIRTALNAGTEPASLPAAGKDWNWNEPPKQLNSVSKDSWHTLLIWQAMCPRNGGGRFRIRNRNIAFFDKYLSNTFVLPHQHGGKPDAHQPGNCDPGQARLKS